LAECRPRAADRREYLLKEGQRVQGVITEYAHMSQAATKSTKIIVVQWKQTTQTGSRPRMN
jgi:hypothetical protein